MCVYMQICICKYFVYVLYTCLIYTHIHLYVYESVLYLHATHTRSQTHTEEAFPSPLISGSSVVSAAPFVRVPTEVPLMSH